MSKLFYDHLISIKKFEKEVSKRSFSSGEKDELWKLVDQFVGNKVVSVVLKNLPLYCHEEFMLMLQEKPNNTEIIVYINEKSGKNIEDEIKNEIKDLEMELVEILEKL